MLYKNDKFFMFMAVGVFEFDVMLYKDTVA